MLVSAYLMDVRGNHLESKKTPKVGRALSLETLG